ncbi:MAG: cyclase family protein, partial [Halobacteria archaeon]|nr:cyclase family protein [Halobacteria archaeon]
ARAPHVLERLSEDVAEVDEDGYAVKKVTIPTHISTHLDAPKHMVSGGKSLEEFPTRKFVGKAVVVDVRGQDEISVDLDNVGVTQDVDMVFFRTGHVRNLHDDYFGSHPVVTEETAEQLVDRGVDIFGVDANSPDKELFRVHDILLSNDVLIAENLTNLDDAPDGRFDCYALPLKIDDTDGAPCRAVGVADPT